MQLVGDRVDGAEATLHRLGHHGPHVVQASQRAGVVGHGTLDGSERRPRAQRRRWQARRMPERDAAEAADTVSVTHEHELALRRADGAESVGVQRRGSRRDRSRPASKDRGMKAIGRGRWRLRQVDPGQQAAPPLRRDPTCDDTVGVPVRVGVATGHDARQSRRIEQRDLIVEPGWQFHPAMLAR
jgi:hypothetical protein